MKMENAQDELTDLRLLYLRPLILYCSASLCESNTKIFIWKFMGKGATLPHRGVTVSPLVQQQRASVGESFNSYFATSCP